jgi:hypothetical protein
MASIKVDAKRRAVPGAVCFTWQGVIVSQHTSEKFKVSQQTDKEAKKPHKHFPNMC